jgi:sugar phosphate isomerase/epimerase
MVPSLLFFDGRELRTHDNFASLKGCKQSLQTSGLGVSRIKPFSCTLSMNDPTAVDGSGFMHHARNVVEAASILHERHGVRLP